MQIESGININWSNQQITSTGGRHDQAKNTEHSKINPAGLRRGDGADRRVFSNATDGGVRRSLAAALARKRPSPLLRGKPETWASGIVHALGVVNFLFDNTQTPHVAASDIYTAFGVNVSTAGNRSRFIRQTLGMSEFDPRWTLPSKLDNNPLVWMLEVNGIVVDVRNLPREVQAAAHRQGLIPYIPADVPKMEN